MSRPVRDPVRRPVPRVALAGLAALGVGCAFLRAFHWTALVVPVLVAAMAPVLAASALAVSVPVPANWRRWAVLGPAALLAAGAVTAALTLFRGAPDPPAALLDALLHGWRRLLNITLPAPPRPDLLLVPAAVVWLTATAGAHLAVRSRSVLGPGLPAVGGLTVAVLLAVPGRSTGQVGAVVVLGALLGLAAVGAVRPGARRAVVTAAVVTAAVTAAAAGCAVVGAPPDLVRSGPFDPRDHLAVPLVPRPDLNPLDRVADYRSRPDERLFTATTSGPDRSARWRLAVLDRYDGTDWSSTGHFTPAGLGVPPAPESVAAQGSPAVRLDVVVDRLRGQLRPAPGRPVDLIAGVAGVDVDSGELLGSGPATPGAHYVVTARAPHPPTAPDALRPATGPATAVELPDPVPPEISALAAAVSDGAVSDGARSDGAERAGSERAGSERAGSERAGSGSSAYGRARALERLLHDRYRQDRAAGAGRSYGHVARFLAGDRGGGPQQFATAFALAARLLGLPSRVVVGFVPGPADGDVTVVHGRDATAWAEVRFAGAGWLGFDASPEPSPRPDRSPDPRPSPSAAPVPSATPAQAGAPPADTGSAGGGGDGPRLPPSYVWWVLVLGLVVLAAGGYVAVVLVVPARRRARRRRVADARQRTVNAWHDLMETLTPLVPTPLSHATAREVVRLAGTHSPVDGADLAPLATFAELAVYGAGPVDDEIADLAWGLADRARPVIGGAGPWWRRWSRPLSPRRLGR